MKTVKSKITAKGNGLMTNLEAQLEICPNTSNEKQGIRFFINDKLIEAKTSNVVSTEHFVVLANTQDGADAKIALVEHFLAACAICRIDNLDVHFKSQGYEVPIMDGSAKVWVDLFNEAGFYGESEKVKPINNHFVFSYNNSMIVLMPNQGKTTITYAVNYNHPDLKNRWVNLNQDTNMNEIVEARTFGYLKDLETFQKMGISKGVSIENTVGMTEDGGYTTQLRSVFEPAKHKILDIIGDLYLTGVNPLELNANIFAKEAGHALHIQFAKNIEKSL